MAGGTLPSASPAHHCPCDQDIDGLVRGDIDQFLAALEVALAEPWGPVRPYRGEVEIVNVPTRVIKPRRFDIHLELRGATWRRIQCEISSDEAGIGLESEAIKAPSLAAFGVPDPDVLVGIAVRYRIAQKLHAVTDPHDPSTSINNRPRDVVDLVLL